MSEGAVIINVAVRTTAAKEAATTQLLQTSVASGAFTRVRTCKEPQQTLLSWTKQTVFSTLPCRGQPRRKRCLALWTAASCKCEIEEYWYPTRLQFAELQKSKWHKSGHHLPCRRTLRPKPRTAFRVWLATLC